MKTWLQIIIVISFIFLYSSCEEENNLYNPKIDDTADLYIEYNRLSQFINDQIKTLDSVTNEKDFDSASEIYLNDWRKIEILKNNAQKLLSESANPSGERTRLEEILSKIILEEQKWSDYETKLIQLKNAGSDLLLAFNMVKLAIFNPNYSFNAVESIAQEYTLLSKYDKLSNLRIFSDRSDYELILSFGRDIRSIRKTYNFAKITSKAALRRTVPLLLSQQADSVRLTFAMLDKEKDNKFFYDVFLEPHNQFTTTGDKFDFDYLYMFGRNIQAINKLIDAYTELSIIYTNFDENYEVFDTTTYNYDQWLNDINNIDNAEELFDSVYSNDFSNFAEMVFFATENLVIKNWVHKFIDFEERVQVLYEKYEPVDTITDVSEIEEILSLEEQHNWLYQQFEFNEDMYDYLLRDYIYNIINEFDNSTVIYKFTVLQQKSGANDV